MLNRLDITHPPHSNPIIKLELSKHKATITSHRNALASSQPTHWHPSHKHPTSRPNTAFSRSAAIIPRVQTRCSRVHTKLPIPTLRPSQSGPSLSTTYSRSRFAEHAGLVLLHFLFLLRVCACYKCHTVQDPQSSTHIKQTEKRKCNKTRPVCSAKCERRRAVCG